MISNQYFDYTKIKIKITFKTRLKRNSDLRLRKIKDKLTENFDGQISNIELPEMM